nr:hexosaminidase D-like [Leptinotarsa decemlineata]
MMTNYMQRVGFTAWRRKTTILIASGLVILIIFGLQFSRLDDNRTDTLIEEERDAEIVGAALMKSVKNVMFIESVNKINKDRMDSLIRSNSDGSDESAKNIKHGRDAKSDKHYESLEMEQQLGIPFVNLDSKNPYVPGKRIVHLDLKGAPPLLSYLRKLFPLIKILGATGVLLEYEDMFPFNGPLKNISAGNAYTMDNIKEILSLADSSKLEVIPLVQTFGHVEFALKHSDFAHLREVVGSPQALCPSRKSSLDFIREMIDQIMVLHPTTKYLHIGCDEVFQMGECDICRLEVHENLFLKHVKNVADLVRSKYPNVRVIVWDDMLRHISQQSMLDVNLGNLVEPMIWVYAEDIYRFVQPTVWEKYAAVFKTAWTASAFKGAFGETLYIPNARRHLENNLRWLDVMATQSISFKKGLAGIAITGWQRYDHFAVLCELLPASIPSLALSLIALTHGYFNSSLKDKLLLSLSCPEQSSDTSPFITLESDPFMWEKLNRCMFPGNAFFRLTNRYHNLEAEVKELLDVTRRRKGWMTSYNIRHNYSLPLRVDELTIDLPRMYHGMMSLARSAVDSMTEIFDNYTISEWIEQKIYPYVFEFELIQNQSIVLKSVNHWPSRPLAPLKDMYRLNIGVAIN